MLDAGTDSDARSKYIDSVIAPAEGGDNAPTVKWVKGDNAFGRIAVVMLAAIAATLFAFLNISLAFTALMAFVGCLLLLVVGVFFACLWIIPGRPRQWGLNWFEALVGLVIQSFLAMLVFGTALTLVTAVFSLTGVLGWLPVSGLAIAVLIAGFRLRRLIDNLTSMMRPGSGSILLGGLARRGAMGAFKRLMGAVGSRNAAPALTSAEIDREREMPARSESPRFGSIARLLPSTRSHAVLRPVRRTNSLRERRGGEAMGRERRALPVLVVSRPLLRRAARVVDWRPQPVRRRSTSALQFARARGQSKDADRRRTISVSAAGVATARWGHGEGLAGGSGAASEGSAFSAARVPAPASEIRYEPRIHTHSGEPARRAAEGAAQRRKAPTSQQRRFREYSAVTKDGVTVHVPTRR